VPRARSYPRTRRPRSSAETLSLFVSFRADADLPHPRRHHAVHSLPAEHRGHLLGDVPALILVAVVLSGLLVTAESRPDNGLAD